MEVWNFLPLLRHRSSVTFPSVIGNPTYIVEHYPDLWRRFQKCGWFNKENSGCKLGPFSGAPLQFSEVAVLRGVTTAFISCSGEWVAATLWESVSSLPTRPAWGTRRGWVATLTCIFQFLRQLLSACVRMTRLTRHCYVDGSNAELVKICRNPVGRKLVQV